MNLQLSLKRKWFDMTDPEGKTEDYRELTPYWYSRLCIYNSQKKSQKFWQFVPFSCWDIHAGRILYRKFDYNIMTLGYPKSTDTERILKLEHKGIEIRTGNCEWGAEPNKLYFVIKHGKPTQRF